MELPPLRFSSADIVSCKITMRGVDVEETDDCDELTWEKEGRATSVELENHVRGQTLLYRGESSPWRPYSYPWSEVRSPIDCESQDNLFVSLHSYGCARTSGACCPVAAGDQVKCLVHAWPCIAATETRCMSGWLAVYYIPKVCFRSDVTRTHAVVRNVMQRPKKVTWYQKLWASPDSLDWIIYDCTKRSHTGTI